jgi:hypothetical protein
MRTLDEKRIKMPLMTRNAAVALLFSIGVGCTATAPTTYHLSYEGILSPDVEIRYRSDGSLAKDLSACILGDTIQAIKGNDTELLEAEKEFTTDKDSIACIMNGNDGSCIVQHVDVDTAVQMATNFQSRKDAIAMRAEITLTADTSLAREALIKLVPVIDRKIGCTTSVWSIQRRASMLEMNSVNSVTAAQEQKDRQAASIDELILSNPLMKDRKRHASTISGTGRSLEVWSYDDVNLKEPVKALFVNGYISATTAPAGAAHVEALVHPALVAHPSPKRVLIISQSPIPIVKEALKYKSVEHISVVGSDAATIDLIEKHMPSANDCSFLLEESPSCMNSAAVEVIEEDVQAWLEHKSRSELFDIILVDVSIGEHSWLSVDMYNKLYHRIESEDSITVVSSGSAPSLFDIDTETVLSSRETFLRQGARSKDNGGFNVDTLVYDEVRPQM